MTSKIILNYFLMTVLLVAFYHLIVNDVAANNIPETDLENEILPPYEESSIIENNQRHPQHNQLHRPEETRSNSGGSNIESYQTRNLKMFPMMNMAGNSTNPMSNFCKRIQDSMSQFLKMFGLSQ
ncbi:uncharacterized protein [Parasteatoda tepidariorum]|nr:uncharacterized protein LOC107451934 isoform X2 [Parasteatoda tepidariorum]